MSAPLPVRSESEPPAIPAGWTAVRTDDGTWTVAHPGHGQACHSSAGAWHEARERYVVPTRLAELAAERGHDRPVRLLDVGTGLGWNLAAAWQAVSRGGGVLRATGLELEPELCRAAASVARASGQGPWSTTYPALAARFAELLGSGDTAGPGDQLGHTESHTATPGLELELLVGDARRSAAELRARGVRFDAIFLDAFSPAVEPDLWSAGFLADLAVLLEPSGLLSTYTVSLTVRERLCRAGLEVGSGQRVGPKAGGTLASPTLELPPLEPRAAAKLRRRLLKPPEGA